MPVTPDYSTLIVPESHGNRLTAFDIAADGGLSNRRVWADLGDCLPDGICLDADDAVWYGDVPNKRCVRIRERRREVVSVDLTGHRAARPGVEAERPGLDRNGAGPWTPFHDNPPGTTTKPQSGCSPPRSRRSSAEMQTADALIAIGHAILANVDPQAAPSAGSAGIAAHWRLAAAALAQRRGLHRQGEVTMHVIHDTDRSCPTPWCSLRHRKHPVNECESAWFPTADHQVLLSNDAAEIEDEPILVLRRLRPDGYTVVSRMTLNEAREVADTLRFVVDLAEAD